MPFNCREQLASVFQDTQRLYTENQQLKIAVQVTKDNTIFYEADDFPPLPQKRNIPCETVVTKNKSFEAAIKRHQQYPEDRITVLNFASATNPGGGVKHGSSAQEESLCRCSTLYPALNRNMLWDRYYSPNRSEKNPLHSDACIWTPGIIICKTDTGIPERMKEQDWVSVDIISCAAPNLRETTGNIYNPEYTQSVRLSPEEQYRLHLQRAKHILHIAAAHLTDTLILGAFGCGAFANDPYAVAKAYRDSLPRYCQYFKRVEFAIFCRGYETKNHDAFNSVLHTTQNA